MLTRNLPSDVANMLTREAPIRVSSWNAEGGPSRLCFRSVAPSPATIMRVL